MVKLTKEERKKMIGDIQYFFESEMEKEIGILTAEFVLDFFLENMGDKIYNKGLDDAKLWFSKRLEDLDSDYYSLYEE